MAVNPNLAKAVDAYFTKTIVAPDPALEEALAANAAAGLPSIDVSAPQGKLIHLLARMTGAQEGARDRHARRLFDDLAGERASRRRPAHDPRAERQARRGRAPKNVARAGLSGKVEIRTGAALETLPKIEAEGLGPFDFVFIDADKENNAAYLEWALRLSRPGTTIVVDNVVRDGEVADATSRDPDVVGVRRMFELMAREPRLSATAIQTVGAKGWDGFALALVK